MMLIPFSCSAEPTPVALTVLPVTPAVVLMALPVLMLPKPLAILPLVSVPTFVILP